MTFAAAPSRRTKVVRGQNRNCAQNIYNHFGCYYFSAVENFICCCCCCCKCRRMHQGATALPHKTRQKLDSMLFNYFACNFPEHKISVNVLYSYYWQLFLLEPTFKILADADAVAVAVVALPLLKPTVLCRCLETGN